MFQAWGQKLSMTFHHSSQTQSSFKASLHCSSCSSHTAASSLFPDMPSTFHLSASYCPSLAPPLPLLRVLCDQLPHFFQTVPKNTPLTSPFLDSLSKTATCSPPATLPVSFATLSPQHLLYNTVLLICLIYCFLSYQSISSARVKCSGLVYFIIVSLVH